MKKIIGTVVFVVLPAVLVVRRFGPSLAKRGMQKCHEMMNRTAAGFAPEQSAQLMKECQEGGAHSHEGNRAGRPSTAANA